MLHVNDTRHSLSFHRLELQGRIFRYFYSILEQMQIDEKNSGSASSAGIVDMHGEVVLRSCVAAADDLW